MKGLPAPAPPAVRLSVYSASRYLALPTAVVMPLHKDVFVKHDPIMGRTIVASRDFEPGETMVRDTPILIWNDPRDDPTTKAKGGGDGKGYPHLLRAFLAKDHATQERILGMYHPALDRDSAMVSRRAKRAAELCRTKAFATLSRDTVLGLILLADCNSHDYSRVKGGAPGVNRAALYVDASLCCHDCSPNCRFRSHDDGSLEYTCVRPIEAEGHVTFSYVGSPWTLSTAQRREKLASRFDFFCRCAACMGPDPLRSARCPGCRGVVGLEETAPPRPEYAVFWRCPRCGPFDAVPIEERLGAELEGIRKRTHAGLKHLEERFQAGVSAPSSGAADAAAGRRDLADFAWRAAEELGPGHFLVARATMQLSAATNGLRGAKQHFDEAGLTIRGCEPVADLKAMWVASTLKIVAQQECAAARCCGGGKCYEDPATRHAPVYECAEHLANGAEALDGDPDSPARAPFLAAIRRYMPMLALMFAGTPSERGLAILQSHVDDDDEKTAARAVVTLPEPVEFAE